MIKAIRGAQRLAGVARRRAHPAAHVLFASGDEGGAGAGDSGAGRARGSHDDAALHAPESGGNGRRDPVAGRARSASTSAGKPGDILATRRGERRKLIEGRVSGAGYGDRTRLTGLGSQDITTMLSPQTELRRAKCQSRIRGVPARIAQGTLAPQILPEQTRLQFPSAISNQRSAIGNRHSKIGTSA